MGTIHVGGATHIYIYRAFCVLKVDERRKLLDREEELREGELIGGVVGHLQKQ